MARGAGPCVPPQALPIPVPESAECPIAASRPPRSLESGNRALAAGDFEAARQSLEAAAALEPASADVRCQLGRAHLGLGERDTAEQMARMAVESDPGHAASTHFLGTLLCERERFAEALPWLQSAAALAPDNAQFQRDLGVVRLFLGDFASGRATLNRTLELDPLAKDILPTLVRMTRMDSGDAEAERLFALTRDMAAMRDQLPVDAQVRVLFALGKALEDRGEFDAAFEAYASGNALHRTTIAYDVAADEARLAAVERVFNSRSVRTAGRQGLGARRATGRSSSSACRDPARPWSSRSSAPIRTCTGSASSTSSST